MEQDRTKKNKNKKSIGRWTKYFANGWARCLWYLTHHFGTAKRPHIQNIVIDKAKFLSLDLTFAILVHLRSSWCTVRSLTHTSEAEQNSSDKWREKRKLEFWEKITKVSPNEQLDVTSVYIRQTRSWGSINWNNNPIGRITVMRLRAQTLTIPGPLINSLDGKDDVTFSRISTSFSIVSIFTCIIKKENAAKLN